MEQLKESNRFGHPEIENFSILHPRVKMSISGWPDIRSFHGVKWMMHLLRTPAVVLSRKSVTHCIVIGASRPLTPVFPPTDKLLAASRQDSHKKKRRSGKTLHHRIMAVGGKGMLDAAEYITRGTYTSQQTCLISPSHSPVSLSIFFLRSFV